jgi:hypothetical protein
VDAVAEQQTRAQGHQFVIDHEIHDRLVTGASPLPLAARAQKCKEEYFRDKWIAAAP